MSRPISLSYLRRIVGVEIPTIRGGGAWLLDGWDGQSPFSTAPGYAYQQTAEPSPDLVEPDAANLLRAWVRLGDLPASCGIDARPPNERFPVDWLAESLRFLNVVGDPFEHRPQLGDAHDEPLAPITLWLHSGRFAGAVAQGFEATKHRAYRADYNAWRVKQPAELADPHGAYMWHLSRMPVEGRRGVGRVEFIPKRTIETGATAFIVGIPDVLTLSWLLLLEEKRGPELCQDPRCGKCFFPGKRGRPQAYCSVKCYDRHRKRLMYSKKSDKKGAKR